MTHEEIVISDVQLGGGESDAAKCLRFLKTLSPNVGLRINGDLIKVPPSKSHLAPIDEAGEELLEMIRNWDDLVVLIGNHDGPKDELAAFLGRDVAEEHVINVGSKRFLVVHGHEIDLFRKFLGPLSDEATGHLREKQFFTLTRSIFRSDNFALFTRKQIESLVRRTFPIQKRAVELARERGFDGIILGHNHFAEHTTHGDTVYMNSGAWLRYLPGSYIHRVGDHISLKFFDVE